MTSADNHQDPAADRFPQLDPVAAEALRRLDALVRDSVPPAVYEDVVVDFLAGEVLANRPPHDVPEADIGAAADALVAELSGELLVETSRRQRNRPLRGAGRNRSAPLDVDP
jgi:hypothetical protein